MQNRSSELSERLLNFASNVIKLVIALDNTATGRHVGGQLARSATSAGANYEEACGAESRADFVHKMQLVLKELRESLYWLRLIEKLGLKTTSNSKALVQEANELANIVAKSILTAKSKK